MYKVVVPLRSDLILGLAADNDASSYSTSASLQKKLYILFIPVPPLQIEK